jgi:hypothetical protein
MPAPKFVEVDVSLKHQTTHAYLFDCGGKAPVWIPKSQVEDYCEDREGNMTSVFIPEWLANEKGLI